MGWTEHIDALRIEALHLYGFLVGGDVSIINRIWSEGSPFSARPGIRCRLGVVDFEVDGAWPLGGSGESSDPDGPQIKMRAEVRSWRSALDIALSYAFGRVISS